MKEIFPAISNWTNINKTFAIATVVKTWGSSPRPIGSTMIISDEMEMIGSVSGGCVEGAVVKAALGIIKKGGGQKLSYGITDEEAWEVGLSCGGSMQVYLEKFFSADHRKAEQAVWTQLQTCLEKNLPCVLLTELIEGQNEHILVLPDGSVFGNADQKDLIKEGLRAYGERKNQVLELGDKQYFAHVFPRKSQMLIIGAAHITVDLVNLAKLYDFETIVIDPRGIFTNKTQFTTPPDQIFEKYPEEVLGNFTLDAYTYAVILSHDPKIDDNALHVLLKSSVGYIGALGSRKTHAKRVARLETAGFSEAEIGRIHSPIGVDIKAKKPREIALSIMGEVIKVQNEFL
jgi:xanthine dehydrogenase accessory factor